MPITRRRLTAAADMKALSHPVRLDLLEVLVAEGAMTASELAVRLAQTPANVSWHLRKLGEHGFVRQATEGPGRNRPWKAVTEALSWGEDAEDESTEAALHDVLIEREVQRLRAALAAQPAEPEEWRDAITLTQTMAWLTADEAQRLGEQIMEMFLATADRVLDPSLRPPGARMMRMVGWIVPHGPATSHRLEDPA